MTRMASVSQPHHGRTLALNRIKRAGLARRLIIAANDSREPKVRQIWVISPSAQGENCNSSKQILQRQLLIGPLREPAGETQRPVPYSATQDNIRVDFDAKMANASYFVRGRDADGGLLEGAFRGLLQSLAQSRRTCPRTQRQRRQ